jgi:hypothetical protein
MVTPPTQRTMGDFRMAAKRFIMLESLLPGKAGAQQRQFGTGCSLRLRNKIPHNQGVYPRKNNSLFWGGGDSEFFEKTADKKRRAGEAPARRLKILEIEEPLNRDPRPFNVRSNFPQ